MRFDDGVGEHEAEDDLRRGGVAAQAMVVHNNDEYQYQRNSGRQRRYQQRNMAMAQQRIINKAMKAAQYSEDVNDEIIREAAEMAKSQLLAKTAENTLLGYCVSILYQYLSSRENIISEKNGRQ